MGRAERVAAIEELQKERGGTTVLTYVTSTRPNFESQMAMDVIAPMYRHLRAVGGSSEDTKIDLFVHSNGGEGTVPWRLVTLLREYCHELTLLVPNRAFSAATLTALGCDTVIMHPMGMLGPTDPTVGNAFNPPDPNKPGNVLGISVEDVASYIALVRDDVGIHHEDELIQAFLALADKIHPLALGNVKRSTLQSRMLGQRLLKRRAEPLADHVVDDIIQKLTSELYFHGHPINRSEARDDVGLSFVKDATPAVADRMWDLYELYAEEMRLDEEFLPAQEAVAKNPLPLPPDPSQTTFAMIPFDSMKSVYVESVARCDVFVSQFEATLRRDYSGQYQCNANLLSRGWAVE